MRYVSFTCRNNRRILALFVLLTLVAGTAYSFHLGPRLLFPDEEQYYSLARNIVRLHFFTLDGRYPCAYRPPGYPFLLAPLVALGAGAVQLRILNFILLALCLLVTYDILRKQRLLLAPVVGAGLVFCYPVFFYAAGTLYPQITSTLLLLLIVRILVKNDQTAASFARAGILYGMLILTVPSFLSTLLVGAIWLCTKRRQNSVKLIVALLVPAVLLTFSWSLRNRLVFGKFAFVSANSGLNLLLGNSENTRPNSGYDVDISRYTVVADKMNDVDRDVYLMSKAIDYVRNHKARTLTMYGLKVVNYFNYRSDIATRDARSAKADMLMLLSYGPLLLLFVARLLLYRRFRLIELESLLVTLYLANALIAAVFFTRIRFRIPYDCLLIIVVAAFVDKLLTPRAKTETDEGASRRETSGTSSHALPRAETDSW